MRLDMKWCVVFLLMPVVLVLGCAENEATDHGGSEPEPTVSEQSRTDSSSEHGTENEPRGLEGRWGMLVAGATKQVGLPLIKTAMAADDSYYLVDVEVDDNGHIFTQEVMCDSYWRNSSGVYNTIIPKAFIDHAPIVERTIEPTSGEPGDPWRSHDAYAIHGARLADPIHDPLPVAQPGTFDGLELCDQVDFGEACDGDEDGHPGVTFVSTGVLGCKLYATSRVHGALDGQIVDDSTISGTLWSAGVEMTLLDASTSLCQDLNLKYVDVLDQCPQLFYFKMVRLVDGAGCEEIRALTSCDEGHPKCMGDESWPLNPPAADLLSCS